MDIVGVCLLGAIVYLLWHTYRLFVDLRNSFFEFADKILERQGSEEL